MKTYFAVIRVPHQTLPEIYYNISDTRKTIEDTIDWDSTIAVYRKVWEDSNADTPFIEPDTIEYDSRRYKLGELVYDSFWDDVHSILTFDTEKDFIEHYNYLKNTSNKPHRCREVMSIIEFYIKCKSISTT
jgi:hypothetical protein